MKLKYIAIIVVVVFASIRCERLDLEADVPRCIKQEIKSFAQSPDGCKGASVLQLSHDL